MCCVVGLGFDWFIYYDLILLGVLLGDLFYVFCVMLWFGRLGVDLVV